MTIKAILLILAALFLILLFLILNFSYKEECISNDLRKFLTLDENLEIISLGSGPGKYGIDFENINRARNLCVWPEDCRYDYRMLKHYSSYLAPRAIVIHCISPLSFVRTKYLERADYNCKYVYVLNQEEVDVAPWLYYIMKYFPSVVHPKLFLKYIYKKIKKTKKDNKAIDIHNQIKQIINGWLSDNPGLDNFTNSKQSNLFRKYFDNNISYFRQIANYCREKGFRYVPIIMPMCADMKKYFSEEFLDAFLYENIRKVGIYSEELDFLRLELFEDIYYYVNAEVENGLFLNKTGRLILTEKVMEYLKKEEV